MNHITNVYQSDDSDQIEKIIQEIEKIVTEIEVYNKNNSDDLYDRGAYLEIRRKKLLQEAFKILGHDNVIPFSPVFFKRRV